MTAVFWWRVVVEGAWLAGDWESAAFARFRFGCGCGFLCPVVTLDTPGLLLFFALRVALLAACFFT